MAKSVEVVESLIRDVLVLAYNAVWSICLLGIRPLWAVHRLSVRLRNPRRTQIAPHTLLFVCIVAMTVGYAASADRLPDMFRSLLFQEGAPPEITHAAIAAFAVLALIDLLIRAAAFLLHRTDRRRQQRFVTLALYVFAAQIVYMNLLVLAPVLYRSIRSGA